MVTTLTNHGTFDVSGAALKTAVDGLTIAGAAGSGAGLYFVSLGNGQVQVLEVDA